MTLRKFRAGLSEKFGVFRHLKELKGQAFFLPYFSLSSSFGDLQPLGTFFRGGGSNSHDRELASVSALGESFERYCLGFVPWEILTPTQVSMLELEGKKTLRPEEFPLFTKSQRDGAGFHLARWTPDLKMYWAKARELHSGDEILIPESLASYGFQIKPSLYSNTSNGCALGENFDMALTSALFELIERDSIMGHWWNKITPPRVQLDSFQDPYSKKIVALFQSAKRSLFVLNGTSDLGVPIAIATCLGDRTRGESAFSMAGAASFEFEDAARRALYELIQSIHFRVARDSHAKERRFSRDFIKEIRSFQDIISFYSQPENLPLTEFLRQGPFQSASDIKKVIGKANTSTSRHLADTLLEKGYRTIYCDLTTRDVRKMGFHAIRSIVPGLIPINSSHLSRPWGVKRIYDFKRRMGLSDREISEKEIYPFPHPFP